ncbi:hypothetical protein P7C71_g2208, partial [Lecanoromycetidae sp. Uapishka_2]
MVIGSRGDIQPFLKVGKLLKEDYGHRVRIATHPAFKKFVEQDSGLEFFSVGGDPAELMAFMVKNPGLMPSVSTVRAGEIGRRRDAMFEMFQGFWRACINATDDETDTSNLKMMGDKNPFVADAIIANPPSFAHVHLPYTYMWSPGLIPKPADWGPEIDIAGFVFLDLASSFKPPETLTEFLEAGEPPVYIGFGSIVVDDPDRFTAMIFEAVEKAGVRALVSKGWGGLGDENNVPDNIYMLENTPHDWLFPRVSAVVHHGGAGTTAIGLKCGKPTMIVPFFGDQPFWGAMVARAGAGAHEAIPYKRLTVDKLAEGIKQCLSSESKAGAKKLAEDIAEEGDGAKNAVESFHRHLALRGEHSMRCSIIPDHVAVWTLKRSNLRLSALAAELLVEEKKIKWQDLRLVRHHDWNDFEGPGEPFTGGGAALLNSAGGIVKGVGSMPVRWTKSIRKREKHLKKQKERRASSAARRSTQIEGPSKLNGSAEKNMADKEKGENGEESGELSHGGQHGAERHLPTTQAVPGEVPLGGEKHGSLPSNGEVLKSAPTHQQHQQDDGEEDGFSDVSEASGDHLAQDLAADAGAGFAKSGQALAKVPMDLSLAIAQGFHNAPRLYGDSTVRTPPRISGIQSGLRAAGSEFAFGVYDGVTGLVKQPYDGARRNGALGFVQGVGKGIGGFFLKDLAAIIGPFGYTLKGVHKELIKGRQPTAFIRKARMIQGGKDARDLDGMAKQRELTKVDAAWQVVSEIRKEYDKQKEEGLKEKMRVANEQRKMEKSGGYETVGHAKKALETKQEERRERENSMAARSSGEERRGSKMFATRGSILQPKKSKEHLNGSIGSNNTEERRGSKIHNIKDSLLRYGKSGEAKPRDSSDTDGTDGERKPKGADRHIERQVLDLGHGKVQPNGTLADGANKPESGLANGTINVTV